MRTTRTLPPITSLFPQLEITPMIFNIQSCLTIPQQFYPSTITIGTPQPQPIYPQPIVQPMQVIPQPKKTKSTLKCKFTAEEDRLLLEIASQSTVHNWNEIAQKVGSRNARQCRERWNNYLNPSLRNDPWTEEEDRLLIDMHAEFGTHWNKISKCFCNRSDNAIRNRWQLLMRHLGKRNQLSSYQSSPNQLSE